MVAANHSALRKYLDFITRNYQINLCFNDFTGFVALDKDLDEILQPLMAHTNPYCMYIKSDRACFNRCLSLKKKIAEKSIKKRQTFFGVCHAGVGEYIIPIYCQEELVGVINAGLFQVQPALASYFIRKTCRGTPLSQENAIRLYLGSTRKTYPDLDTVAAILELVAAYLGNAYLTIMATHSGLSLGKRYRSSEDSILAHILDYIKCNYTEALTVPEIARFCHCSESYVNHLFKKRVGINIKMYINKIRIEAAQEELTRSDRKISDISTKVGFSDSNYFSRVFTELVGIPPAEFRRRFS